MGRKEKTGRNKEVVEKEKGTGKEKERKYEWAVAKHVIWTIINHSKKAKGIYLFDHFWFP